jgi:hypothetical protein
MTFALAIASNSGRSNSATRPIMRPPAHFAGFAVLVGFPY